MPTLVVGMLETRENYDMPTASVGMAPFSSTCRKRNYLLPERESTKARKWREFDCRAAALSGISHQPDTHCTCCPGLLPVRRASAAWFA